MKGENDDKREGKAATEALFLAMLTDSWAFQAGVAFPV
jgi:hypothetical protein